MVYEMIGRAVVKLARWYVVRRYGTQLRVAGGLLAVAVGIAVYLAARDAAEG